MNVMFMTCQALAVYDEEHPGSAHLVCKKTYHTDVVNVGHSANLLCVIVALLVLARCDVNIKRSVSATPDRMNS